MNYKDIGMLSNDFVQIRNRNIDSFVFRNKVSAVCYAPQKRILISGGEDGVIVFWDMRVRREEVRHIKHRYHYLHTCYLGEMLI